MVGWQAEPGTWIAAAVVGLLGGGHCLGMCGGIVGALTFGLPAAVRGRSANALPYLLAYNAGRLASYTLAGAIVGGLGWVASHLVSVRLAQLGLQVFAGVFMVALGAYVAGVWQGLTRVEALGTHVWRRLEPLGRRLLPVTRPWQALQLGLVWGWLPCGLVYSVLIWTLSAGGAVQGALLMFSFGVGTLPALLAMGLAANRVAVVLQSRQVRAVMGAGIALYGLWLVGQAVLAFSR